MIIIPWLIQLIAAIVPVLLNFLMKHSDKYITQIFSKLGNLISAKSGESAAVIISTTPGAYIEFSKNDEDIIKKLAPSDGTVTFSDSLDKGDKIFIKAYCDGYISDEIHLTIDNEFIAYCVSLKLDKQN